MIRLKEDVAWIGVGKVDTSQNIVIVLHLPTTAGCLSFAGFISITLRAVSYSGSRGSTSRPLNLLLNLLMTRFGRNKDGELATAGAESSRELCLALGIATRKESSLPLYSARHRLQMQDEGTKQGSDLLTCNIALTSSAGSV